LNNTESYQLVNNSQKNLLHRKFKIKLAAKKESRKQLQNRADEAQLKMQNRMYQLSNVLLNVMDSNVRLEEADELLLCNIRNTSLDIVRKSDKDGGIDNESFSSLHDEAKDIVRELNQFFQKSFQRSCHLSVYWIKKFLDGAKSPNLRIYRMTDYELKELKSHLDDLLAQGFI